MKWSRGANLFAAGAPPARGERFEELARLSSVRIERIVSSAAPDSTVYDQAHDEWVVLLRGEARLEIAGEEIALSAGDTLMLPKRTPHRVLATSAGALWLAIHGD